MNMWYAYSEHNDQQQSKNMNEAMNTMFEDEELYSVKSEGRVRLR